MFSHARKSLSPFGPLSFYKQALAIAIPVMLQSFISSLISLIDNFMVAGLGDIKMAGVNAANQTTFVFLVLINTLCQAGSIYLSQHRGAGNKEGMQQAFRFKLVAGLFASFIFMGLILIIPQTLVRILVAGNTQEAAIVVEGTAYIRALCPSYLFTAAAIAYGSAYRVIGQGKIPLIFSTIAALINTVLNWVFIYGKLGAPKLGIEGAALATDIARFVELATFIFWSFKTKPAFYVQLKKVFFVKLGMFGTILFSSGMMLVSELTWVFSEIVITALYNARGGAATVAGMAAAWTIGNLFFTTFGGIQTAVAVTVGTSLGAGDLDLGRKRANWLLAGAIPFGTVVAFIAALSVFIIPLAFKNLSLDAQHTCRNMVLVIAAYMPLWLLLNGQFAVSRTGGDMAMGIWVDVSMTWLVFLPLAFGLAWFTPVGPVLLFAVAKLSDFGKVSIAAWWLKKEKWVRNLAAEKA